MFTTRSLDVTPKATEQHLIARSDKSAAYVRLCSTFCAIEGITTDRHEASRGLFATAQLLVVRGLLKSYSNKLFLLQLTNDLCISFTKKCNFLFLTKAVFIKRTLLFQYFVLKIEPP